MFLHNSSGLAKSLRNPEDEAIHQTLTTASLTNCAISEKLAITLAAYSLRLLKVLSYVSAEMNC